MRKKQLYELEQKINRIANYGGIIATAEPDLTLCEAMERYRGSIILECRDTMWRCGDVARGFSGWFRIAEDAVLYMTGFKCRPSPDEARKIRYATARSDEQQDWSWSCACLSGRWMVRFLWHREGATRLTGADECANTLGSSTIPQTWT